MKNFILCFIFCAMLSGCTTIDTDQTSGQIPSIVFSPEGSAGFTNIRHVHVGMTYEEVTSIMGPQIKIGYKRNAQFLGGFEAMNLKNPYRAEILRGQESIYSVMFYFTNVKKADGIISEDELTPLVFKDNKLVGKGNDFLFKLKDELKIKAKTG